MTDIVEPPKKKIRHDCPYLDTVNRAVLDFDFEKVCSVTLANVNVYGCLVCGRYFQGRGRQSPAYEHSLELNHRVFINLVSGLVYCLPDDYEVIDPTLDDIRHQLEPRFKPEDVKQLDSIHSYSRALDGTEFLPGLVGLNNIKINDAINCCIQALLRVRPLRDFMLRPEHYADANAVGSAAHLGRTPLVQRFGELLRKMWNPRNFKAHVSPHELLQAVSAASSKRFRIGAYADPIDFLKWFLNELHKDLGGTRARNSSIVYAALQGELRVTTFTPQRKPAVVLTNAETGVATEALGLDKGNANDLTDVAFAESTAAVPFLTLELDIPPPPLFKDELQGNVIPQVPLQVPLQKFDGVTTKKFLNGERRCYALTRLPPFLIMHLNRFTKNNFFTEKNPTIVNFPIRNLDLFDYLTPELKARVLVEREYDEAVESGTVGDRKPPPTPRFGSTRYDLVANIRHEGKPGEGTYKVHVHHSSDRWFDVQDLLVDETIPQLIAVSEAYILFFERQKSGRGNIKPRQQQQQQQQVQSTSNVQVKSEPS